MVSYNYQTLKDGTRKAYIDKTRRERTWRFRGIKNMSMGRFQRELEAQEYLCAICHDEIDESACADHDHATGEFRGVLCSRCNLTVERADKNPKWLEAIKRYLEKK